MPAATGPKLTERRLSWVPRRPLSRASHLLLLWIQGLSCRLHSSGLQGELPVGGIRPNLGYSSLGNHSALTLHPLGAGNFGVGLCEPERVYSRGNGKGSHTCVSVTLFSTCIFGQSHLIFCHQDRKGLPEGSHTGWTRGAHAGDVMWQLKGAVSGIELQSLGFRSK